MERKDFITIISHDLSSPISIARGYAEALLINKNEISRKEFDNYVEIILKKILQAEHMVNQLFEISKMESPEFKANKEPFVLSEIVRETVNTFQLSTSDKKVALKCIQCQYHVWVNADIRLMERVVQNLIEYSIKNTPENGEILIGLEVKNNNLIFKLENTGPPLAKDLLQSINNPGNEYGQHFDKPGTGLGLSIVKKILYMHNSFLQACSTSNEGTIFTFGLEIYNRNFNP